jgi:GNAT superfamily N-acetyltransferase
MTSIRPLGPEDREAWSALWRGYLDFYDTRLPDATYDATWSRLLAGQELHGLAAWTDDRMVGITHYMFHPTCWDTRPLCYLQDLFVEPDTRGTGAGRALIEAVGEAARARNALRVYWMTQAGNTVARQLYDRLARHAGFIRYDLLPTS